MQFKLTAISVHSTHGIFAFIQLDENNALRVWSSTISNQNKADAQAGEIIAIDKQGVHVACGENTFICLTSVQY